MDSLILDLEGVDLEEYRVTRHELRSPSSFTSDLMSYFESDPLSKGCYFPFPSSQKFRLRPGELTVLAAENFAGKSALASQSMLYWLRDTQYADVKQKWLLISPEFSPKMNLARLVQQICARMPNDISGANVIAAMTWLEGRMLIYDVVGQVDIDDISNTINYAVTEHGITGVIIDNLTVLQIPGGFADNNSATQHLVTKLVETTRVCGCHTVLIAHHRKPAPGEKPSRYSIRGSSTISDLADNVITMQRQWNKERKLADEFLEPSEREEVLKWADTQLSILKQRHGTAWTGDIRLYYDPFSMRWSEQQNAAFLPFEEIEDIENLLEERNGRGYQDW